MEQVLTILVSRPKGGRRWIRNSTAIFAQRVRRRAAKNVAVVGVVSCLTVTGFAAAMHGAGVASSIQTDIVSMAHTHKGDRLPLVPKNIPTVPSPVVTTLSRPPIGCEPAFSRVADPKRSYIFGRCIS
jgi:hypothetical protein